MYVLEIVQFFQSTPSVALMVLFGALVVTHVGMDILLYLVTHVGPKVVEKQKKNKKETNIKSDPFLYRDQEAFRVYVNGKAERIKV